MTPDNEVLIGSAAEEKARSLEELVTDDVNWTVLYRDRASGALWKQSYRWPASHAGGAPQLEQITRRRALLEFDLVEEDLDGSGDV